MIKFQDYVATGTGEHLPTGTKSGTTTVRVRGGPKNTIDAEGDTAVLEGLRLRLPT